MGNLIRTIEDGLHFFPDFNLGTTCVYCGRTVEIQVREPILCLTRERWGI